MPRAAGLLQIFFVQLLERPRFAVRIKMLADLQTEQLQRVRGRARAGAMRADDNDGRMSILHRRKSSGVTETRVQMFEGIGSERLVFGRKIIAIAADFAATHLE